MCSSDLNYGRSWSTTVETVPTDLILDDGGQRFEQHSGNPRHATWLDLLEKPQGRLQVQRVYKHVTKAQLYIGDNTWTEVQDFPTKDILFDGGASIGWTVPEWHREEKTTSGKTSETPAEKAPTPAPKQETPTSTPKGQRFSYIRVSSTDQNLARQREMVGPVDKEFCDELSARSRVDRPGLERCLDYLRDHDELRVASIDRLARSLVDLRCTWMCVPSSIGCARLISPRSASLVGPPASSTASMTRAGLSSVTTPGTFTSPDTCTMMWEASTVSGSVAAL